MTRAALAVILLVATACSDDGPCEEPEALQRRSWSGCEHTWICDGSGARYTYRLEQSGSEVRIYCTAVGAMDVREHLELDAKGLNYCLYKEPLELAAIVKAHKACEWWDFPYGPPPPDIGVGRDLPFAYDVP